MLPNIPGLGVWRAESKGWNAAAELPGTAQVLQQAAAEGRFIPMVLRLEPRSAKRGGQTRRFVVPVIDLPQVTMTQLAAGEVPLVLNAPVRVAERPALPAAPASPSDDGARFANDSGEPPMGEPPALPGEQDGDKTGPGEEAAREPDRAGSGQAGGEPAEQERALAQTTHEPASPFQNIKNSISNFGANISKLLTGSDTTINPQTQPATTVKPQKLP